jgi:hypothetical protein
MTNIRLSRFSLNRFSSKIYRCTKPLSLYEESGNDRLLIEPGNDYLYGKHDGTHDNDDYNR